MKVFGVVLFPQAAPQPCHVHRQNRRRRSAQAVSNIARRGIGRCSRRAEATPCRRTSQAVREPTDFGQKRHVKMAVDGRSHGAVVTVDERSVSALSERRHVPVRSVDSSIHRLRGRTIESRPEASTTAWTTTEISSSVGHSFRNTAPISGDAVGPGESHCRAHENEMQFESYLKGRGRAAPVWPATAMTQTRARRRRTKQGRRRATT